MNFSLPVLPIWQARSFWAQLLMLASVALNAAGIDLMSIFGQVGLGDNPDAVIDTGLSVWQTISPLIFGFWAWWERRAPNYRLGVTLPGKSGAAMVGMLMLTGLMIVGSTSQAHARPQSIIINTDCLARDLMLRDLAQRLGQTPIGSGTTFDRKIEFLASPDDDSWTIILVAPDGNSCVIGAGPNWLGPKPTGEPL
ncbi:hypothetical protein [Pseudooceanicola spongiae]|uniref:Uncharacterized protein n=1 Tax=Pseudooceanicola spongiae TaxID=2613965 RepID=A0A7L9WKK2_9RHOB|nr:hypothetical protein [Pseudooceanicola spongiae]QOL80423.1 hypothetical protein F3W81_06110 [Pseudooceanicola spongiae]